MSDTAELLLRWAGGDQAAMATLVQQDAPWIEAHVRRRLGTRLRQRVDTQDIVQETLLTVLRTGPRFVCSHRAHLRALLARMVENTICAEANRATAGKRDLRRETPGWTDGPSGSVLLLDAGVASVTQPGAAAERNEMRDWVRLGIELLEADDRNVILWREYEEASFAEIGARLGIPEDAARMRFGRAVPKLAKKLAALRAGQLATLLQEDP